MSQLTATLNSPHDEESLGRDSASPSTQFVLEPGLIVLGKIDGSSDHDYYEITLSPGAYNVTMTSDATLYGWSSFRNSDSLEFDIVDENDNIFRSSTPSLSFDDTETFITAISTKLYVDVHGIGTTPSDYALAISSLGGANSINPLPVAGNDSATVFDGQPITIEIGQNDSDADNIISEPITTSGLIEPQKGTVIYFENDFSPDTALYTPFNSARGTDTFTYQVSDKNGNTDTAIVTVNIIEQDIGQSIETHGSLLIGNNFVSNHAAGDEEDWFSVALSAGRQYIFNNEGISTNAGTISDPLLKLYDANGILISEDDGSGEGTNAQINFVSNATATFFIASVSNVNNGFPEGSYTISANSINTAPVANNDEIAVRAGQTVIVDLLRNDLDVDNDQLFVEAVTNPSKGSISYTNSPSETSAIYSASPSAVGNDSFIYQLSDGSGATDTAIISVFFSNEQPIALDDKVTTRVGVPVTVEIGANDEDPDGDLLQTIGITNPARGTVVYNESAAAPDTVTYTPLNMDEGEDSFEYQVLDGKGGSDTATVTITTINAPIQGVTVVFDGILPQIIAGTPNDDSFFGSGRSDDTVSFILDSSSDYNSSEFVIVEEGNEVIISSNLTGTDSLISIENYQFNDGTFQLSDLLNVTDIDRGIYRFFNVDTGTHFLSGSSVERDSVINNLEAFNYEGATFRAADPTNAAADTVFRFFNTQTGTHFFTQSIVERDNILNTLPQFSFEGEAYKGYTEQVDGSIPLYRFFNTQTGTHFYTAAEAEKNSIIENLPTFNFEGTAYWVDPIIG